MRRRRKYMVPRNLIVFLVLLFFGMGLGYAVLAENLFIDGNVGVEGASWFIYFDNVSVSSGSVTADTPSITNTTVSFGATLIKPGDFYEFTVDVVNNGSLAAKLDSMTFTPELTQEQSNYFKYTVTYSDGVPIKIGDALEGHHTETIRVRFEYIRQVDTTLYPTIDQFFDCHVSMYYIQGHGNDVLSYRYAAFRTPEGLDENHIEYVLGRSWDEFSGTSDFFDTVDEALQHSSVYVRLDVNRSNTIVGLAAGMKKDGVYYHFVSDNGESYEQNVLECSRLLNNASCCNNGNCNEDGIKLSFTRHSSVELWNGNDRLSIDGELISLS